MIIQDLPNYGDENEETIEIENFLAETGKNDLDYELVKHTTNEHPRSNYVDENEETIEDIENFMAKTGKNDLDYEPLVRSKDYQLEADTSNNNEHEPYDCDFEIGDGNGIHNEERSSVS